MTRILEENKHFIWLVAGTLAILVAVIGTALVDAQQNFHATGKGSNPIVSELMLYMPTLTMAVTLLLLLCFLESAWFPASVWRLLFCFALAANVIIVVFILLIGFLSNPEMTHHSDFSLLSKPSLVVECTISLLIVYFRKYYWS